MQSPDRTLLRFVRALLPDRRGKREGEYYVVNLSGSPVRLEQGAVRQLMSRGVIAGQGGQCWANDETRPFLARLKADGQDFGIQHRIEVEGIDGAQVNLAESPLARLAAAGRGEAEAFLLPHHVEAGERIRRLVEQAHMQQRITMSYSASHVAGGQRQAGSVSEIASAARKRLAEIHKVMPADCAGVVIDVCGLLKGLQVVESERGWPRRSAKLVLRIGLEQLAVHFGLAADASGPAMGRMQVWLADGARPERFE
jgi:Domain of unknown function (DUF6456)